MPSKRAQRYAQWVSDFNKLKRSYGDELTKQEQYTIVGYAKLAANTANAPEREFNAARSAVGGLRRLLLRELKMLCQPIGRGNCRIAHPEEQAQLVINKFCSRMSKALDHAKEGLEYTNTAYLTNEKIAQNVKALRRIALLRSLLEKRAANIL